MSFLIVLSIFSRMSLAAPRLYSEARLPRWTEASQRGSPSVLRNLSTSTPTRTYRSKAAQKASRKVKQTDRDADCFSSLVFWFIALLLCLPPPVEDRLGKSEEPGRLYLNKVFHISASKMFELLFTDSSFVRRFMDIRRITSKGFKSILHIKN